MPFSYDDLSKDHPVVATPTLETHALDLVPFSPLGPPSHLSNRPQTTTETSKDQSRLPLLPSPIAASTPSIPALSQPNFNPSANSQQQSIKTSTRGRASKQKILSIDDITDEDLNVLRQSKKMQKDKLLQAFGSRPVIYKAKSKGGSTHNGWKPIKEIIIPHLETSIKCQISIESFDPKHLKGIQFAKKLVFKQESGAKFANVDELNAKIKEAEKAYLVYICFQRKVYLQNVIERNAERLSVPSTINVPVNISPSNSTNVHYSHSFSNSVESNTNASLSNSNFAAPQQINEPQPTFSYNSSFVATEQSILSTNESEGFRGVVATPTLGTESMTLDHMPFSPFDPHSLPQTPNETSEGQAIVPLVPFSPLISSTPSIPALAQSNSNPNANSQPQAIKSLTAGRNKKAIPIFDVADKDLESLRKSERMQEDRFFQALSERPVIYKAKKGGSWTRMEETIIPHLETYTKCQISSKNHESIGFEKKIFFKQESGAEFANVDELNAKIKEVEKAYLVYMYCRRKVYIQTVAERNKAKKLPILSKTNIPVNILPPNSTNVPLSHSSLVESNASNSSNSNSNFTLQQQVSNEAQILSNPSAASVQINNSAAAEEQITALHSKKRKGTKSKKKRQSKRQKTTSADINLPSSSHSNSSFTPQQQVNEPQPTLSHTEHELLRKILSQLQSDQTLATVEQTKQEVAQVLQEVAQMKQELAQTKQAVARLKGNVAVVTGIQQNQGYRLCNIEMLDSQQTSTSSNSNNTMPSFYTAQNPNLIFQPATGSTIPTLQQLARGFPTGG